MKTRSKLIAAILAGALAIGIVWLTRTDAHAHCDTLDGPVVKEARAALEKGDVAPVLKWVKKEHEAEIRKAFDKTVAVRGKGAEAKDLADTYFLETLVRLHRAGEGAPFTGLKPAGTDLGPAVTEADRALESGSVDKLVKLVTDEVAKGIRHRFERVAETKKHADHSVEAGREYVEAYVDYVHYVERLATDAEGKAAHHGEGAEQKAEEGHQH